MGSLVRFLNVKSAKSTGYPIVAIGKLTERIRDDLLVLQNKCETFQRMFLMKNEMEETVFGG